jgi:hypothetical protein
MSTDKTINVGVATELCKEIARLVNEHHAIAPYAALADELVRMQESGQHAKVHTVLVVLQRAILTGTGWKTADNSIADALKRRGYVFTSKVDYRTREKPSKTFKIGLNADVQADKKRQAELDQAEADAIEADAQAERARLKAEADAKITAASLAGSVLADCARLGIDPHEVLAVLSAHLAPKTAVLGETAVA